MMHICCGDGKGKTTAAMGMALRMAGRGRKVLVAQFCKGADSGERTALGFVPGVTLLPAPEQVKFTFLMNGEDKERERERYRTLLMEIGGRLENGTPDMLALDEICAALNADLVELPAVLDLLDLCARREVETVLTGRNPPAELVERAHYITRMEKVRHPYDQGAGARKGVEY